MGTLLALLAQGLHVALVLAAAPLLAGLPRRLAARLLGGGGAPLGQPWRDLRRLLRKQPVVAETASPLFILAPPVVFAASLAAVALVPSFALGMTTAPVADLLVIAGLLAFARCTLALAAMDAGTAAGGLGAAQAMAVGAFAEPALLLVVLALGQMAGTTNLDAIAAQAQEAAAGWRASAGLALLAAGWVVLAVTGRAPLENPAARLEPAPGQAALTLEHSGRHLALLEWAAALRLLLLLSLLVAAFAPFGVAGARAWPLTWIVGLLAWATKLALLAGGMALLEAGRATLPPGRGPGVLGLALLLALLAVLLLFLGERPA